jgi:microcystin-dependent protein
MIAFSPHVTNGATVTLNVDGLGAKPLRSAPNAELLPGTIIQGTPYVAVYNNTDGAFYLQGLYGNPYNIPLAASIDFWAPTAPNSSFAFPYGQSISRTTYAALFALIGTTYGAGLGDGLTFSLPDLRGRVVASPDNLGGGSDQNRLTSGALAAVRFSLGGVGGESGHTLTVSELPSHTHSGATGNENQSHSHGSIPVISSQMAAGGGYTFANGGFSYVSPGATGTSGTESQAHNHNFTTDAGTGGNQSHNVVQPTILANRIMRII